MEDHVGKVRQAATEDYQDLQDMVSAMKALAEIRGHVTQNPMANITVQAGGAAVWGAVTACIAMVLVTLAVGLAVFEDIAEVRAEIRKLEQKDDVHDAYINSGLVQPKEEPEQ